MSAEENPSSNADVLVGRVLAERYRVDRLLGSGGMGSVYLAEHVLMKKAVALKVLHRELTAFPEVVKRFEREAVAAARIDHPNVAAASDFGRLSDGSFYLVLEYVDGKCLRTLIEEGPIERGRALAIARQIADALSAAHAADIVHRDLKPDNVMLVTQPDGRELVKVLDFGVAKVVSGGESGEADRQLTRVGAIVGTAGYMAPEQALGQAVDHRADLYAFGVVLYELVSGSRPYEAEDVTQILAKQLTDPPAPLPPGVEPELSALVFRLLARAPEDRPGSARELVAELDRVIEQRALAASDTVLGLDTRSLPRSARAVVSAPRSDAMPAHGRWRLGLFAATLAVFGGAAAVAWSRHAHESPHSAPSATAASAIAPPNPVRIPEGPAFAPSASPPAAAPTEGGEAKPASVRRTTVTESKTTHTDGRTTRRVTRRTTVSEQHTQRTTKRHTGPGGIYIPPPSEWFK
jgi:serine/threonine-protein kinase